MKSSESESVTRRGSEAAIRTTITAAQESCVQQQGVGGLEALHGNTRVHSQGHMTSPRFTRASCSELEKLKGEIYCLTSLELNSNPVQSGKFK